MSIVSWMVGTADGFLADAAESQFGAVASNTGTIVLLMVTLSLIGVCINMAFQFRSMDGASFFWYLVKLTLIGLFAFNWANFNAVATAIIGGLDYIAGALISSVGGGGAGATYFAGEFDRLITEFSQYLNAIGNNLNWMTGAILGGIGLVLLSLLGFMTGIVLIFAKMMLTLMLGLAPIMIALSLFDATKDFFHRWVSTTISYAFYPIVIAAVWQTSGFVMAMFLAGLRGIDEDIWKASRVDGIPTWKTYLFVVVPMMRPVFITTLVIVAAGIIKLYDLVVAQTSGGPGNASQVPAMYVYDYMFQAQNLGQGFAASTMMLLSVLIVLIPWAYLEFGGKKHG